MSGSPMALRHHLTCRWYDPVKRVKPWVKTRKAVRQAPQRQKRVPRGLRILKICFRYLSINWTTFWIFFTLCQQNAASVPTSHVHQATHTRGYGRYFACCRGVGGGAQERGIGSPAREDPCKPFL